MKVAKVPKPPTKPPKPPEAEGTPSAPRGRLPSATAALGSLPAQRIPSSDLWLLLQGTRLGSVCKRAPEPRAMGADG